MDLGVKTKHKCPDDIAFTIKFILPHFYPPAKTFLSYKMNAERAPNAIQNTTLVPLPCGIEANAESQDRCFSKRKRESAFEDSKARIKPCTRLPKVNLTQDTYNQRFTLLLQQMAKELKIAPWELTMFHRIQARKQVLLFNRDPATDPFACAGALIMAARALKGRDQYIETMKARNEARENN